MYLTRVHFYIFISICLPMSHLGIRAPFHLIQNGTNSKSQLDLIFFCLQYAVGKASPCTASVSLWFTWLMHSSHQCYHNNDFLICNQFVGHDQKEARMLHVYCISDDLGVCIHTFLHMHTHLTLQPLFSWPSMLQCCQLMADLLLASGDVSKASNETAVSAPSLQPPHILLLLHLIPPASLTCATQALHTEYSKNSLSLCKLLIALSP